MTCAECGCDINYGEEFRQHETSKEEICMNPGCLYMPIVDLLGRSDTSTREHYDACIEAAGSTDAFRRSIGLVKPNGHLILVGNPSFGFQIDQTLYWQILRKQLTVRGIWNSSYPSDWQEGLDNSDKLQLDSFISHKYNFRELDKAFEMIWGKSEKHMKVIAVFD